MPRPELTALGITEDTQNQALDAEIAGLEGQMQEEVDSQKEAIDQDVPRGEFSAKGLSNLADSLTAVGVLLGQPAVPAPEGTDVFGEFPPEIAGPFLVTQGLADAAIAQEVISQELEIAHPTDDSGLRQVVSRIDVLLKDQAFRKYLKDQKAVDEKPEVEVEIEVNPAEGEDVDALFASRS